MPYYLKNERTAQLGLMRIRVRLSAKGQSGDIRPLRHDSLREHPEVKKYEAMGFITVLTNEEYATYKKLGALPDKAPPPKTNEDDAKPAEPTTDAPESAPKETPEDVPKNIPAEIERKTFAVFKELTSAAKADYLKELGLGEEVDMRSTKKMLAFYKKWYSEQP